MPCYYYIYFFLQRHLYNCIIAKLKFHFIAIQQAICLNVAFYRHLYMIFLCVYLCWNFLGMHLTNFWDVVQTYHRKEADVISIIVTHSVELQLLNARSLLYSQRTRGFVCWTHLRYSTTERMDWEFVLYPLRMRRRWSSMRTKYECIIYVAASSCPTACLFSLGNSDSEAFAAAAATS